MGNDSVHCRHGARGSTRSHSHVAVSCARLPVWQLDGARGFRALSAPQRWLATAALFGGWALTQDGIFVLLLLVAGFRAFARDADPRGDRRAAFEYVALVGLFAVMIWGIPQWLDLPATQL